MKIIKINAVWCSGCLVMKKIWKEVQFEYPNLEIINYDYDMDDEIVKELNVGEILPVVIFQKNNKEVRLIGEKTKNEIIKTLENI